MREFYEELMNHDDGCGCGSECGCGHDHDHDHEHEHVQKINLVLDDGTELKCIVIATFELKEKEYIALLPEEQEDVFLYEFKDSEDGIELINIEDDDEFDLVSKAFYEMVEAEEDEEE